MVRAAGEPQGEQVHGGWLDPGVGPLDPGPAFHRGIFKQTVDFFDQHPLDADDPIESPLDGNGQSRIALAPPLAACQAMAAKAVAQPGSGFAASMPTRPLSACRASSQSMGRGLPRWCAMGQQGRGCQGRGLGCAFGIVMIAPRGGRSRRASTSSNQSIQVFQSSQMFLAGAGAGKNRGGRSSDLAHRA